MKKRGVYQLLCLFIFVATLCLPAMGSSSEVNVALNQDVTFNGTYNGTLSTVTDGIFLRPHTQWQTGTVWWNGTASYAEIDLGGTYVISSFKVQADDNDTYLVQYYDLVAMSWVGAWNVSKSSGGGMMTRESGTLSSSITTDKLRFYATGGDNMYSVSEIQAYGSAVPIPGALWLFAPGLAALAGFRKKLAGARSR